MNILITGGTGFIGNALCEKLCDLGHQIKIVTRNKNKALKQIKFKADFIQCDLNLEALKAEYFNNIDVVVHLAGESIDGYWTEFKKQKILNSRKQTTENLFINCPDSVKVIVSASAQGIYGNRNDEELTEESQLGHGFLADVCKVWEQPVNQFVKTNKSTRVVVLRIGLVLSSQGGVLARLVKIFNKNIGAVLGSGKQWMSWISLDDLTEVIVNSITLKEYVGVINAVNNAPVTNSELTHILSKHLRVFTLPRVPEIALKIIMGEMSALVLGSLKVAPEKLNKMNHQFLDTDLKLFLEKEIVKK